MAPSTKKAARGAKRKAPSRKKGPSTKKAANGALSPKQCSGINAILNSPTLVKAAEVAGVTEQTIHNWLKDHKFRKALGQAYDDVFRSAVWRLKRLTIDAVNRLAAEMAAGADNSLGMPCKDRISAADKILNHALRFADAVELKQRVAELEARIDQLTSEATHADCGDDTGRGPGDGDVQVPR